MSFVRESVIINGKPLTFETGRLAKQAHGAVLMSYGESVVLITAVSILVYNVVAAIERPVVARFGVVSS